MKILHLYTNLNVACGISRVIRNIISMGQSYEAENHVAVLGGDAIASFTAQGIKVKRLKYGKNKIFFLFLCIEIFVYCRRNKIEIIHSHHRYMDFVSYFVGLFSSVKLIATAHSIVTGKKAFSFKTKNIVAVSESVRRYLIEYFNVPEGKIKVIQNAVYFTSSQVKKTSSEIKKELFINDEKKIIFFAGRFDFDKGIDILLNAIKILSDKRPDFTALLIGDGTMSEWVDNFIHENRLPVIVLKPCWNIYDYYQIADIIVLASRVDTFPFPMLEAGIMRKAFIGTNVYGIGEFIRDKVDGLLVESLNIAEFADALETLLDNSILRNSLAEKLYDRVNQHYLVQHKIPQYYELYETIINT